MKNKKMWKKFLAVSIGTGMLLQSTVVLATNEQEESLEQSIIETTMSEQATMEETLFEEVTTEKASLESDIKEESSEISESETIESTEEKNTDVMNLETEVSQNNEQSSVEMQIEEIAEIDNNSDFVIQDGVLVDYKGSDIYVVVPDGVTKIGDYAFAGCNSLKSIQLPNTVTYIGDYAFSSCNSLESIQLPERVTEMGEHAFMYCRSLKNLKIPEGATYIEFYGWGGNDLESIQFPSTITRIDRLIFGDIRNGYKKNFTFFSDVVFTSGIDDWKRNVTEGENKYKFPIIVNFEYSTEYNGGFAPDEYIMLVSYNDKGVVQTSTQFNIPTITTLEPLYHRTLYYHRVLEDGTTEYVGTCAIDEDGFLSVTQNQGGTYIVTKTRNATAGEDFSIENGVLFKYRGTDSRVVVPEGVTEIAESAFRANTNVKEVILPEGVTKIGYLAFFQCSSLASIQLPSTLNEIGYKAFYECSSLESIKIPEGVKKLDYSVFAFCRNLSSVVLPNTLEYIDEDVFFGCKSLESIDIPEGVKELDYFAFASCTNLSSVVLPNTLERIGGLAFESCTSLKEIYIPQTVADIASDTFINSGLTAIYGIENSYAQQYASENGFTFKAITNPIVELEEGKTTVNKDDMQSLVDTNNISDVVIKSSNEIVFTFPKGTMKMVDGIDNYDFGTSIDATYPENGVLSFTEDEYVVRINYNYSGELPATATISIFVGKEFSGQTLYYHKLLENGGSKYITSAVVDENGIYTIQQSSCSDYIITTVKEGTAGSNTENGGTTGEDNTNSSGVTDGNNGNNGTTENSNGSTSGSDSQGTEGGTNNESNDETSGNQNEIPNTGDSNIMMIYVIGMICSIACIIVGFVSKRKNFK